MSGARYTRGPWRLDGEERNRDGDPVGFYVAHQDSGRICETFVNCLVRTPEEARANAQLLACATELVDCLAESAGTLSACADILRRLGHDRTAAMVQARHEAAVALLVKATGPLT